MAVKTDFSLSKLQDLLTGYTIGQLEELVPLTRGSDQTNIVVKAERGKYVFRYYEKRSDDYVQYEIDLLDYLTKHQFPSPVPVFYAPQQAIGHYADKPFVLFQFMEGGHDDSPASACMIAQVIAQLHTITNGLNPKHSEVRAAYDQAYVLRFASANAAQLPHDEAQARLSWLTDQLAQVQLPAILPKGAIHGDLNPGNFLYTNGKLSAVLDFDQSSYTYLLHDVAQLIYWWAWGDPVNIDWQLATKLLKIYENTHPLNGEEKQHLYDMLLMVNLISMGWDFASDDFLESQRRVNYLQSVGHQGSYERLFDEKA